jgi:transposase
MPKPYSLDLRQKVINAIELDGMKKSEASAVFGISRNTIDLWLKRKAATGSVAPPVNSCARRQRRIPDWERFRAFAEQHRHKTQAEMAELWPGEMSQRTISRALQQINWTRKKRPTATVSETSKRDRHSSLKSQSPKPGT